MVIGVLSVLLAIILPTIKTVRAAALRRQAAAETQRSPKRHPLQNR